MLEYLSVFLSCSYAIRTNLIQCDLNDPKRPCTLSNKHDNFVVTRETVPVCESIFHIKESCEGETLFQIQERKITITKKNNK